MRWALAVLGGFLLASSASRGDVPADNQWTDAERWAWSQIAAGQTADFDVPCRASPATADDSAWKDPCRTVRGVVLEQMLTRTPWRDAMQHRGLWLNGARITGDLDLANAHFAPAMLLTRCRIEGDVLLARARFDSFLAFDGSRITGALNGTGMLSESDVSLSDGRQLVPQDPSAGIVEAQKSVTFRNARIKGSLLLNRGHFEQMVDLRGAHVDEDVQTSGADFKAALWAGSMQIGGKLSINATRFGGDALFPNSTIGGLVDASESTFAQQLNLVDGHVAGDVFVNRLPATNGVNISGTQIGGSVTLAGSSSKGAIAAANTQIAGDLQFDEKTHLDGTINLAGLRLGGSLKMSRAPFGGEVNLRNAHIVGDAVIKEASFAHGLNIRAMQVEGDLLLQGAHLAGDLLALNLDVRRDLLLDGAKFDGAVNLFDGRVANSVHMEHADFQKELSASSIQVVGDMRLDDARFAAGAVLAGARVGGDLNLSGASINGLDLTGATIGGTLEVDARTTWLAPSRLSLVNATVGRLQDGPVRNLQSCPSNDHPSPTGNGWPTGRTIELEGFTYGHLGSSAGSEGVDMRERDVCWWRWWLERDAEFSSQPYVQLAAVMAAHGDQDNAARILYFGRVRETQMAWQEGNYLRWMLLAALSVVTGYGIGTYTFRVLLWIVVLTVIGVIVLKRSPAAGAKTFLWRAGASLSRVLPGIEINKEFSDFFDDPNRQRLKDWQIVLFSAFVMIGWVLGLFLVAAMTGLTQHS